MSDIAVGKLHFPPRPGSAVIHLESPYDEPYIIKRGAHMLLHLSPYIGLFCLSYLIGWGCHQSRAAESSLALRSVARQKTGSDLGLIPPIQIKLHRGWKAELNPKTNRWVFMSAVKSSILKRLLSAHPCLSSAWHEINYMPVKWAFLAPISLLTSWG